jgi:hypothetical protein
MAEYLGSYKRTELTPEKTTAWEPWTPRKEEMEENPETQTPVIVTIEESGYTYQWNLRKGMEWADFKFLVNSKIGREDWEAHTNKFIWDGEQCNGRVTKPSKGQRITVRTIERWSFKDPFRTKTPEQQYRSFKIEEKRKTKSEAWNRLLEIHPNEEAWELSEEEREEARENQVSNDWNSDDPYITVDAPFSNELLSLQVPKGNEWAYFTAFMDSRLGEGKWVAGFNRGGEIIPWVEAKFTTKRYQVINVMRTEEKHEPFSWKPIPITPLRITRVEQPQEAAREAKDVK